MVNVYDTEYQHPMIGYTAWLPSRPAEQVNDHIWLSRSNSYAFVVASDDGDLVINTGTAYQGDRHRERFEQEIGRLLDVRAIVLTQSHWDHIGGLEAFRDPEAETIVHERFSKTIAERRAVAPYIRSRPTARMFSRKQLPGEPEPTTGSRVTWDLENLDIVTCVHDRYEFSVGGRNYEVISVPGGETLDGLAVWLPAERTVWTGNLMGAVPGALPHLSTIRGDRPRSAVTFIESVQAVLDLEPELMLQGHGDPMRGAGAIRRDCSKVMDAVRFIHDRTIEGMNEGKDLPTLMREITLPSALQTERGRGPVAWCVRAVWEEYVGWFRGESLTELYAVPQAVIHAELADLAGGIDTLADRARVRAEAGEPLAALHYTDIVLGLNPDHEAGRRARVVALETLYEREQDGSFDLARLLELELAKDRERLSR